MKSEGGRGGTGPQNPIFSLCPCVTGKIDELVKKNRSIMALFVMALRGWATQRYMRVDACHHRQSRRVNTHKDGNPCGCLDVRGII